MNGWWKLNISGIDKLNDIDREHVAKLIIEGYVEGQIIQEDKEPTPSSSGVPDLGPSNYTSVAYTKSRRYSAPMKIGKLSSY